MSNKSASDIDEAAEDEREIEFEALAEVLWHIAESAHSTTWDDNAESMNFATSEQSVGGWLRRLREQRGAEFAAEVHAAAVAFGKVQIEDMEATLMEAKRGQAILERPAAELIRSLIQVAKPNA